MKVAATISTQAIYFISPIMAGEELAGFVSQHRFPYPAPEAGVEIT
jgi:hypothetical protein